MRSPSTLTVIFVLLFRKTYFTVFFFFNFLLFLASNDFRSFVFRQRHVDQCEKLNDHYQFHRRRTRIYERLVFGIIRLHKTAANGYTSIGKYLPDRSGLNLLMLEVQKHQYEKWLYEDSYRKRLGISRAKLYLPISPMSM